MDIFECFNYFNSLKNYFPLLYNLEGGDIPEGKRTPINSKNRIIYGFFSFLMATSAVFMVVAAGYAAMNDGLENILGIVYFIDNYAGPLISQCGLYVVTQRPVPVLARIYSIDEFLFKEYRIVIDYKRVKRNMLIHFLLSEGTFSLVIISYIINIIIILGTTSMKNLVLLYFGVIWFIFILQLIIYSTIIKIIRIKVELIQENIFCFTPGHRAKLSLLLNHTIKGANLIGNGIIFLFMGFSTFYVTMDSYVVVRHLETYGNHDYFLIISATYISLIIYLNGIMVHHSYSLKKELDILNKRIGQVNDPLGEHFQTNGVRGRLFS